MKKDDTIKNIIAKSKLQAPENLKYRIMQQVSTENVFLRKNRKENVNDVQVKSLVYVLVGIYAFLLVVFWGGYFMAGNEIFQDSTFYYLSATGVIIGTVLAIINYLDNKLRYKD